MNPTDQAVFDRLIKLNPEDLTPEDRKFLNARKYYLNNEQIRVFESVLIHEEEESEPEIYVSNKDRAAQIKES